MIIKTVGELLGMRRLVDIAANATITEACARLNADNIGALAVCDEGALVGILSERDIIRNWDRIARSGRDTKVADVMTHNPVTIERDSCLAEALRKMKTGGFRHLPVIEDGRPTGMLSFRDIPTDYRVMQERFESAQAPLAAE